MSEHPCPSWHFLPGPYQTDPDRTACPRAAEHRAMLSAWRTRALTQPETAHITIVQTIGAHGEVSTRLEGATALPPGRYEAELRVETAEPCDDADCRICFPPDDDDYGEDDAYEAYRERRRG